MLPGLEQGAGASLRTSSAAMSEGFNDGTFMTDWSSPFIVERQGWASAFVAALPWLVVGVVAWKLSKR